MKTLPKQVDNVLTEVLGDFELTRVITEELNIGVKRIYLCGSCSRGFFAAWNEVKWFYPGDVELFKSVNDAWNYISNNL